MCRRNTVTNYCKVCTEDYIFICFLWLCSWLPQVFLERLPQQFCRIYITECNAWNIEMYGNKYRRVRYFLLLIIKSVTSSYVSTSWTERWKDPRRAAIFHGPPIEGRETKRSQTILTFSEDFALLTLHNALVRLKYEARFLYLGGPPPERTLQAKLLPCMKSSRWMDRNEKFVPSVNFFFNNKIKLAVFQVPGEPRVVTLNAVTLRQNIKPLTRGAISSQIISLHDLYPKCWL